MSIIIDTVLAHLPFKQKKTPSGWISFDCVACRHIGTSPDTRKRAGVHVSTDSISYSCFNCGFKASWANGKPLSNKFKKLLGWLNVPNDAILVCIREGLQHRTDDISSPTNTIIPSFAPINLPEDAKPIKEWINKSNIPTELVNVLSYMHNRGLYIDDCEWYWTADSKYNDKFIIPFKFRNTIVGYTCRTIKEDTKYRYLSEQPVGYVFNIDNQLDDRKFVIIVEGPIDAVCIDAVSVLGSKISNVQHAIINNLEKEVIIVPDRDEAGSKLIDAAIEYNWSVSFPDWDNDIKDVNDAVKRYGRLYTLYSIIKNRVSSSTLIRVKQTLWFNI